MHIMIGILSGAGPLAGVDVAKKLIEETKAFADQEHLPLILSSIPAQIPDRSQFLLGKSEENPGKAIGELFLHLEKSGATIAALACNTAHAKPIFKEVLEVLKNASSSLKVLNIVQETVNYIKDNFPPQSKIGIISTSGTRNLGLYREALENENFKVIETTDEEQENIQKAIYDRTIGIKAQSSPVHQDATGLLKECMEIFKERGADVFLLGCTELPLAIDFNEYLDCKIIDPNRLLARALIKEFAPEKLKN